MKRRQFIRLSSLASASLTVPGIFRRGQTLLSAHQSGKRLIIIQLTGGNDGLNTMIPYSDDTYFKARGKLAIRRQDALYGHDLQGFHPALSGLKSIYDQGWLSIVNSVGYPEPNLSHFRSMDIWHTGSDARDYLASGWLGRWLDQHPGRPHEAIQVDQALALALKGDHRQGFALRNPQALNRAAKSPFLDAVTAHRHAHEEDMASYLYQTLAETQESAAWLLEKSKTHSASTSYPATQLGKDLRTIAELITADSDTRIYYASLTGFDTHVNQANRHERMLRQYDEAVTALVRDLKAHDLLNDTLIMTFSEFGRRVQANGSGGTDHGTASVLWLINEGHLVKPGFVNAPPDLIHLQDENMVFEVDFRSIYADILRSWLDTDPQIILGTGHPPIARLLIA